MKLIIGLGNPGRRYEGTPHNVGFTVADELARRWSLAWKAVPPARAETAEGLVSGVQALLVKPLTFMNLSGESVAALARNRELGEDGLLVVVDDVALPIGRIRLRPNGSHGGHNGLRSIIERLGHQDFPRLRVGIKPRGEVGDLADYVLGRLPPLEREQLREMIGAAADAAETWLREGSRKTADLCNGIRRFEER